MELWNVNWLCKQPSETNEILFLQIFVLSFFHGSIVKTLAQATLIDL